MPAVQTRAVACQSHTSARDANTSAMTDQEDPDGDGGLERLVASMVTSGLPENDPPVENVAFYPLSVSTSLPDRPWFHSTGNEDTGDSLLTRVRELRRTRERRPTISFSSSSDPNFQDWCHNVFDSDRPTSRRSSYHPSSYHPSYRRASPIKISRGSQTVTLAIPRFPVESRSFPVPWGKRLRTRTVATQTEEEHFDLIGATALASPVVPAWDTLPQEMFTMDELRSRQKEERWATEASVDNTPELEERWSTEASFGNTPELEQIEPKQTFISDISRRLASLMRDCSPEGTLDDASYFTSHDDYEKEEEEQEAAAAAATRDWEEEVEVCFIGATYRTVSTNTIHVGWRRGPPPPPPRVRSRTLSQGWNSNPARATTATQTQP
ncbi:hypothetical protein Pmani_024911 [Petrolisthes manimaculis]|uniref:Uncharacterized protein n=1 Tax=Petrolisthes manimaculis TaxID=1843537 RepID=A0AAE1U1Q0_9EUCA|nr:hypothetical protein Pmani_024911 [Petrolisthes manimaculis]